MFLGTGVTSSVIHAAGAPARGVSAAPKALVVLAVRSSSIVIATLLAGRLLAERVSPTRLAGSILVFAGVALLAV